MLPKYDRKVYKMLLPNWLTGLFADRPTKPFLLFVESLWSNTKMLSGIIGVVVSDCFKEDYPFEPKTTATGEIYQISNSASSRYFIRQDDRLSFECW